MKLSVIIPAYNGAKTLTRAIDSLLAQTLTDIEIIIVDDGSSDETATIADQYASKHTQIIVIHKEKNEGLSAGRNTGIKVARGQYITFLDCDDWAEPDMYNTMLEHGDVADVIVTGALHDVCDRNGDVTITTADAIGVTKTVYDRKEIVRFASVLDSKRLFAYTWNKLYRRAFLEACQIEFQKQTLIEDYQFNVEIWSKIKTLSLVDGCYYHYIKFCQEALTQKYLPDYFEIIDKRFRLMKNLYTEIGGYTGEDRRVICAMHIKHLISGMNKNCNKKAQLTGKTQRRIIKQVLRMESCIESVKYGKGSRIQEKICYIVLKYGRVWGNYLFAKLLYWMQHTTNNLFDRMK